MLKLKGLAVRQDPALIPARVTKPFGPRSLIKSKW
jgi:hypothetical protein